MASGAPTRTVPPPAPARAPTWTPTSAHCRLRRIKQPPRPSTGGWSASLPTMDSWGPWGVWVDATSLWLNCSQGCVKMIVL
eukprot:5936534-Pyramimonas_sp.AAC.1